MARPCSLVDNHIHCCPECNLAWNKAGRGIKWVNVNKVMPSTGHPVMAGNKGNLRIAFWLDGKEHENNGSIGGGWRDWVKSELNGPSDLHFLPTHWQMLPEPPIWVD